MDDEECRQLAEVPSGVSHEIRAKDEWGGTEFETECASRLEMMYTIDFRILHFFTHHLSLLQLT